VQFANGVTNTDWSSDGQSDAIMLGYRPNFNAHGFNVATFYIFGESDGNNSKWNIVPLIEDDGEKFELFKSGGADCVLHDFRLLKGSKPNDAMLIVADRELTQSYADSDTVTFSVYSLKVNLDGLPGSPMYYFTKDSEIRAQQKYCDVGEAFKQELGLDSYSREEQ